MTRKSHKGIVGKFPNSKRHGTPVGDGIDFVARNLRNSHEIEKELENVKSRTK